MRAKTTSEGARRQPTPAARLLRASTATLVMIAACGDSGDPASTSDTATTSGGSTDASTGEATGSTSTSTSGSSTSSSSSGSGSESDGSSGTTGVDENPNLAACGMGYAVPGTEQVPGDAEAGYYALLGEGYVTCGIPYALFPIAKPFLGSFAEGEVLPGRTGKNATVPYNWTVHTSKSSGAEIVSLNCLECHAGHFNGELIIGLGKADADYTESIGGFLAKIPVPGIPIPGLEEMTRMAQRYQIVGDYTKMLVVGTNPADGLAAVLSAHRDADTLEWSDDPLIPIGDFVVPADTPPWWNTKKKHGLFCNGMSRGDHRATMIYATSLCTDSVEEAAGILSYFNNIRAFIMSVEAPKYPFAVDDALADAGEAIFAENCSCCHGVYADDPAAESYPNLLIPLDVVGTDGYLASEADALPFAGWFNGSWYGEIGKLTTGDPFVGYLAPPLDGIWATAPYFHNASVPTLDLVLQSGARPQYWRRVDYESTHYDQEAVGWPWKELAYGQEGAPESERKHVYDTTVVGHSNSGHPFGDHLSDEDRRALIEYLKTI
ncbi:MAG: c-type cytochrome [Nannocystaceae bacterium]